MVLFMQNGRGLTLRYPVLLNGMITTASVLPISLFQFEIHFSSFSSFDLTAVRPRSSHSQNVATPRIASVQALTLQGLKASMSSVFMCLMILLNSSSVMCGSRISGYRLLNVGAKSPFCIQSLRILIMRVVWYNGESRGT